MKSPERPATLVRILVTSTCLAVAAVHLLWPRVEIDAVTLGLVAISISPWLGEIFASVEGPGGWKVQYRELERRVDAGLNEEKQRVSALVTRVDQVEQFVFSGSVTEKQARAMQGQLHLYRQYLEELGFRDAAALPKIHVGPLEKDNKYSAIYGDYNAFYVGGDENFISVGQLLADDVDAPLREYTHHVLTNIRPDVHSRGEVSATTPDSIESALADYFPCSFRGDPCFGRASSQVWKNLGGAKGECLRNLDNEETVAGLASLSSVAPQQAGLVWAGAFWRLRQRVGAQTSDACLLEAYREADSNAFASTFVRAIVSALHKATGVDALELSEAFSSRGLPVAAP